MTKVLTLLMLVASSFAFSPAYAEDEANPLAKQYSPKFKQFAPPAPGSPPGYFTMEKNVVNFRGEGRARFLAVDFKFLSYYPDVVGETGWMENLRPILKNDLDRVLRNQTYTKLSQPDGPDLLREEVLKTARGILEKHNIYPDLLDDVYITKFVMQ